MPQSSWTRVLFEAIDDAVFIHDAQGNILDANPAAARRLGYTHEELLQLNTRDIDAPEFAAGFQTRLESQLATGHMRCEGIHRTKSGRRIYVDINTSAIQLDGKPAVLAVMRDITARKQAEDYLGKQRQLLQSILDNMTDAVVVTDRNGSLMLFNPSAERIFGGGLPRFHFSLFQADRVTPVTEFPAIGCARGESFQDLELFVQHADAPEGIWVAAAGRPLREIDGTILGGVVVCTDITEHKRVETELRDSKALYESLVQSLPQNILRKDLSGRLTFGNQRYCASMKKPLADLLGKTDFDLFPEDLARKYVADDRHVMQTGKTLDTIEGHHLPDGRRIFVHIVKTPIFNAEYEVVGVQGIFWDVTEEVIAHETVARSEKRYRQLTEAIMDGIIVIDQRGHIALFNPAAERMFGYSAQQLLGKPAALLIPDEFKELHAEGVANYLRARLPTLLGRPHEVKGKRKDGSEFPAEIALSLIADPGENATDRPVQILAAIRDLTERNKMRAVLVQNEKLASIGLLSAGVAHEINNPLSFVANNLVVLERDCKALLDLLSLYQGGHADLNPALAERIRDFAAEIDFPYIQANTLRILGRTRDGIERVTRIVQSLRGMARTGAHRRQDVRIPDVINGTLEILHGKFKHLGISVEQTHDPVPVVSCVSTQISQVILNLLLNAFQAIEAAGRKDGRIRLRTVRRADEFVVEIEDNGGGIPADHLPLLFDPFFTTKDVGEGTGLGLSICHHIVTAHGGRIEVDTQPGKGTCFRVCLPLTDRPVE
ncbi:MAG: PAS domain S-box protein [Planctomycetes bacterium]|nr:PAS domain S-box protein [Planctomycetota bacterium]